MKISRILHAGYILETGSDQIAFDPIFENPFSVNCFAFPEVKFDQGQIRNLKLSAVFISHYHDDHCSMESLSLLDRATPIYVYCVHDELFAMIRQLGFKQVFQLELDSPVYVGEFKVTAMRALDVEVDSIFHIQAEGLNILNVVDSWIDEDTLAKLVALGSWDFVMWPFQTMREIEVLSPSRATAPENKLPDEWMAQLKMLSPRVVVPSSCQFRQEEWSWYNKAFFPISYRQFKHEIEGALPNCRVIRIEPSCRYELSKDYVTSLAPLPWIQLIGSPEADYHFDFSAPVPSTAEIATRFPPLRPEQAEAVDRYCKFEVIEKFNSMSDSSDQFFSKPRTWRLTVYNHAGSSKSFFYQLSDGQIKKIVDSAEDVSWVTEVIASKLYAALNLGETLTSLYLRVNDIVFSPQTEAELAQTELTQDPLIRCLYTGAFGAYQRAQLKRLDL